MSMAKERKQQKGEAGGAKYVRLPQELWERLAALADAHERSINGEAVWAVRRYVNEEEARRGKEEG